MKATFLILFALLGFSVVNAQTQPTFGFDTTVAGVPFESASLFGNNIFQHNQTLYTAFRVDSSGTPVQISALYFKQGANQNGTTLDSLTISLGMTRAERYTIVFSPRYGNPFFKNVTPVYVSARPTTLAANTANYDRFALTTPYLYDGISNLIVDVRYINSSNAAFVNRGYGDFRVSGAYRTYAGNQTDTVGSSSSSSVFFFGYDILTALPGRSALQKVTFYPNPATNAQNVRVRLAQVSNTVETIRLSDATGRVVWQGSTNAGEQEISIPTADLPKGSYLVVIGNGLASGRLVL